MRKPLLALVCIAATLTTDSPAWACGGQATLSWTPPTLNIDGTPLTDLNHYELYWRVGSGTGYPNSVRVSATDTSYGIGGLPDSGVCYFVIAAFNVQGLASAFSNEAVKAIDPPGLPPGKPSIAVSWFIPPPIAASVTVRNTNQFAEFDLTLVGAVDFVLTAPSGARFDYCGTTVPPINANNDGVTAPAITIRGPITDVRCDLDPITAFSGFSVTVGGVTKPLVQFGSSWGVSF